MIPTLLFYAFAAGILAGAGAVVLARNPMVAVLGMIFAFLNASGLFILMGAEFLGLLLIMVYVGAIAVMFLFVLMTIDIDFATLRKQAGPGLPVGLGVVGLLLVELVLAATHGTPASMAFTTPHEAENVVQLGSVLFTDYALPFQMAGLILLTAMVGAIVLTHRRRVGVKRQNVPAQIARLRADSLAITTPESGQGATARYWHPKSVDATPSKPQGKKKK